MSGAGLERAAGYEQGMQLGMQQGIQQDRRENSVETARKLKALGVADDVISQSADLSVEEIECLHTLLVPTRSLKFNLVLLRDLHEMLAAIMRQA